MAAGGCRWEDSTFSIVQAVVGKRRRSQWFRQGSKMVIEGTVRKRKGKWLLAVKNFLKTVVFSSAKVREEN